MDVCRWCGEPHDTKRLCQQTQRGLTRRSFCFLFGAGVASVATGGLRTLATPAKGWVISADQLVLDAYRVPVMIHMSEELLRDSMIRAQEIERNMKVSAFRLDVEWNP